VVKQAIACVSHNFLKNNLLTKMLFSRNIKMRSNTSTINAVIEEKVDNHNSSATTHKSRKMRLRLSKNHLQTFAACLLLLNSNQKTSAEIGNGLLNAVQAKEQTIACQVDTDCHHLNSYFICKNV
jgi:hypothetical protein